MGEAFQVSFSLVYDLQYDLRLLANVAFNAAVFGLAIDAALPLAYLAALRAVVLALNGPAQAHAAGLPAQPDHDQPDDGAHLQAPGTTSPPKPAQPCCCGSRISASAGTWRSAPDPAAIMLREGWSALGGVLALCIILAATALIVWQEQGQYFALLIRLCATPAAK